MAPPTTNRMLTLVPNRAIVCSSLSIYYRTLLVEEDITYTVVPVQILVYVDNSFSICSEIEETYRP